MRRLTPLLAGLLAACAVPASPPAIGPRSAPDLGLTGASVPVATEWWKAAGDPQLDRIVADALADSPNLNVAEARVRQAQAQFARADANRGPDVALDAQVQAARLSGRYTIPPPFGGTVRELGTVQAGLSWDLDLFGRQKAAIAQAAAGVEAARYDAAAARLMLTGAVTQAYAELTRAERQAEVANRAIQTRRRSLALIDTRVRNQLASRLDQEAARTLVAQADLALVRAQAARVLATDALAALAGRGPDYARSIGPTRLPADIALPVPTTIPADLLARRADVAAARARVEAAAAGRQVARRAFYPNINLTALIGLQAIGLANFIEPDAGTAGIGSALHLPLFDNGRLKADLAGATAAQDVATAQYNQAVVGAAREAADAIARVQAADTARARQRAVVAGFAETGRLNAIRVSTGLDSRLTEIDNDIRLLDAELAAANLTIDALSARAALAVALGGGFAPLQEPAR